jgi:hypothetical protein
MGFFCVLLVNVMSLPLLKQKKHRSFTLLELLAIISFLAGIAGQ